MATSLFLGFTIWFTCYVHIIHLSSYTLCVYVYVYRGYYTCRNRAYIYIYLILLVFIYVYIRRFFIFFAERCACVLPAFKSISYMFPLLLSRSLSLILSRFLSHLVFETDTHTLTHSSTRRTRLSQLHTHTYSNTALTLYHVTCFLCVRVKFAIT